MKQVETYAPPKENGKIMLNANELYCDLDEALRKEVLHELSKLSFHRYPDETSKELIKKKEKQRKKRMLFLINVSGFAAGICVFIFFCGKRAVYKRRETDE